MIERLTAMRETLSKGGVLSKADKSWLKDNYKKEVGSDLITNRGCRNCWLDGVIVLNKILSENKIQMLAGAVVKYNGKVYNRHNITDEVARQILCDQPQEKDKFYNIKL